jgi:uncharacterized membrane protein
MAYMFTHLNLLHRLPVLLFSVLIVTFILDSQASAQAPTPVVRAVLFYSPTCGHCHKVMEQDLPPLQEIYGNQLLILEINTATPEGQYLYNTAQETFKPASRGVPLMLVGREILIGSGEIPNRLPTLIEAGLKSGGIDWPELPGLEALLPVVDPVVSESEISQPDVSQTDVSQAGVSQTGDSPTGKSPIGTGVSQTIEISPVSQAAVSPLWLAKFLQDPFGNGLAVVVLVFMLYSLVGVGYTFVMTSSDGPMRISFLRINWPQWTIPVLCAAGIVVAGYLSFGELAQTELVCGPVGDCNAVQQSPYATLWGVLPVGILGMAGFAGIFSAWLVHRLVPKQLRNISAMAMWGMAVVGVLFSMYLTFLEPFVIGATCIWCITTATIITMLLWVTTQPVLETLE